MLRWLVGVRVLCDRPSCEKLFVVELIDNSGLSPLQNSPVIQSLSGPHDSAPYHRKTTYKKAIDLLLLQDTESRKRRYLTTSD